jgi:tetratricopeptide (TPR) repeat protein
MTDNTQADTLPFQSFGGGSDGRAMNDQELDSTCVQARAHLDAGRLVEAERGYLAVLRERPEHAAALHGWGRLALARGRPADADKALRAAAQRAPGDVGVMIDLARCCQATGDTDAAEVFARLAVLTAPHLAASHLALAAVVQRRGRAVEALPPLRRALELEPGREDVRVALTQLQMAAGWNVERPAPPPQVCYRLGRELQQRGRRVEATEAYRSALELQPDFAEAMIDLAMVHQQCQELDAAIDLYRQALAHKPDSAQALCNRALALQALGRREEAMQDFEAAQALVSDAPLVRLNKAMLLLMLGRWDEGWVEYEWRWKLPRRQRQPIAPTWDGSALGARSLLVFSELGMGDTIQMLRYLPRITDTIDARAGGRLFLACQEPLRSLIAGIPGVEIITGATLPKPADVELAMSSLPRVFKTRPDNVPPQPTTLHIPDQSAAAEAAGRHPRPRIGLVWAGAPEHLNDDTRSIPLGFLQPLAEMSGHTVFSLQKGPGERALDQVAFKRAIIPLGPLLSDMAQTAAAIVELDLVISVDTAVAHLAATLGKPTWLMLPYASEWRWMLEREDTPWYPTMRIFRQRHRGNWTEVVERMMLELKTGFGGTAGISGS